MSHVVLTCTCTMAEGKRPQDCPVPGHGNVPPDKVDIRDLVEAGIEAEPHLAAAVDELMKARAAWVSRGLPADNAFPRSLDRLARTMTENRQQMARWVAAAMTVRDRRAQ